MGFIRRPIMETFHLYDDRNLMCSLDNIEKSTSEGTKHYLIRNGYSIISNLFHPDKEFDIKETENILSNIFSGTYTIKSSIDKFIDYKQTFILPEHDGMSLFIQIDTNSAIKTLINASSNQVELSNNEAILFDRSRIHFSHTPVQSRYNFLGKLFGKLLLKKDDTYYRYICIDYVKE